MPSSASASSSPSASSIFPTSPSTARFRSAPALRRSRSSPASIRGWRRSLAAVAGALRRARHGHAQPALQDPAPARVDPDHDRALLGQPPHHGPAEHRHPQPGDDADAVLRPRPPRLSRPAALPRRARRHRGRPARPVPRPATSALPCAPPAPIRAWRGRRASAPSSRSMSAWRCRMRWSRSPGALFAQTNGFADVTAGVGTIVIGLAAVIIGETLFRFGGILVALIGCVVRLDHLPRRHPVRAVRRLRSASRRPTSTSSPRCSSRWR